ncbi:MAG: hypothetical protein JST16_04920 [Bdellovibrionales bacterium]|nr:hypothetical protein [Bdellovibrionales bacterium]
MSSISQEKLEANRANAQLSTGPVTDAGKQRSSQNAVRHGLNAKGLVVTPETQPALDSLEAELRDMLEPEGILEETSFAKLLTARWNMIRVQNLELDLQAKIDGQDPLSHPDTKKDAALYHRYYMRYESSYNRALKELKDLQTTRAIHIVGNSPKDNVRLPVLTDPQKLQAFVKRSQTLRTMRLKTEILEVNRLIKQSESVLSQQK